MTFADRLEKYKGKTVDEAIQIEKAEEEENKRIELIERNRINDLLKEIAEHKYYLINHNNQSFSYCKINNINLNADTISFFNDGTKFQIQLEPKRTLNQAWLLSPYKGVIWVKKIDETTFNERKEIYNQYCLELKNQINNLHF